MIPTRRLLCALVLGLSACQGGGNPPLAVADYNFIMEAAAGSKGEVTFGQMAERQASDSAVRRFADQMITDHTTASIELLTLASRKGVSWPTVLDPRRVEASVQLSTLTGTVFDQQYMAQQVQDHDLQLALYRQHAQSSADPELRFFAAKYLPVVEAHAQMARGVLNSLLAPQPQQTSELRRNRRARPNRQ